MKQPTHSTVISGRSTRTLPVKQLTRLSVKAGLAYRLFVREGVIIIVVVVVVAILLIGLSRESTAAPKAGVMVALVAATDSVSFPASLPPVPNRPRHDASLVDPVGATAAGALFSHRGRGQTIHDAD